MGGRRDRRKAGGSLEQIELDADYDVVTSEGTGFCRPTAVCRWWGYSIMAAGWVAALRWATETT